jgi:hypothetical protein
MARLCERPGCSAPAACVYGIDSRRLSVWIDGTVPDDAGSSTLGKRAGVLCRRHADSMVVPIGWTLDDRRAGPAMHSDLTPPVPLPRPGRRRVRRPAEADSEQLALLDVPADAPPVGGHELPPAREQVAASATSVVDEVADAPPADAPIAPGADEVHPAASPWRPVFDQTDDLGGLLATRSPLLARAFRTRDRVQSSNDHDDR